MNKLYELSYYHGGCLNVVYAYGVNKTQAEGQVIRAEGYVKFEEVKEVDEAEVDAYYQSIKDSEVA